MNRDSGRGPAMPPMLVILEGGKVGAWYNSELSWERVTG